MIPSFDPRNRVWDYNSKKNLFITEASDLGSVPTEFEFVNSLTGTRVRMKMTRAERDREGDTVAWYYHCDEVNCKTDDPTVDLVAAKAIQACILND